MVQKMNRKVSQLIDRELYQGNCIDDVIHGDKNGRKIHSSSHKTALGLILLENSLKYNGRT